MQQFQLGIATKGNNTRKKSIDSSKHQSWSQPRSRENGKIKGRAARGKEKTLSVVNRIWGEADIHVHHPNCSGVMFRQVEIEVRDPFKALKEDDAHVKADLAIIHSHDSFSAGQFRHRRC